MTNTNVYTILIRELMHVGYFVLLRTRVSQKGMSRADRSRLELTENYIRLSVGLESTKALIQDLNQALNATFQKK